MNRIWSSIVGKLWGTILLLVSFVLFIVTVLILEFLQDFHLEQAKSSLTQQAQSIIRIFEDHDEELLSTNIVKDILAEHTNLIIALNPSEVSMSYQEGHNKEEVQEQILSDSTLSTTFISEKPVVKEMMLPSLNGENQLESFIVLASPLEPEDPSHGAVFIYQSLDVIQQTTKQTTNIVFLSAFIAFVLTTFFAFFLSTKITSPLRKMREAAFELAKGNFETKVPAGQNDEMGQLATAFNQMGRQLKHHLEVIHQEKEQLSNILTSMTDAVVTFNRDMTILLSNPQAEKIMQKWFLKGGAGSKHPIPAEIYHMLDHVMTFEEGIEDELEIIGSYYFVSISPLYSRDSIRGAVVVLRDMTEQHKLEKLRSDFIANVSHELRTPISMLQGYSEAIMDDVVEDEAERKEIIKIIYEESQRMGRLVTDLLDLARLESGHMRLYTSSQEVVPVVDRIVHKFQQRAKEEQIELSFVSDVDAPLVAEVDEDRIEQVLTNLIDNAIRHTPEEGNVTVRVEKDKLFAKVSVIDTGSGIPEEDLPYVFERFYKADKARTRGKGGTGLGLAIAKNIIESHQGTITVDSKVNNGTHFAFYLPLKNV